MSDRNDRRAEHALDLRGERLQRLDDIRYLLEEGHNEAAGQALLRLGTEIRYAPQPGMVDHRGEMPSDQGPIAFLMSSPAPF